MLVTLVQIGTLQFQDWLGMSLGSLRKRQVVSDQTQVLESVDRPVLTVCHHQHSFLKRSNRLQRSSNGRHSRMRTLGKCQA